MPPLHRQSEAPRNFPDHARNITFGQLVKMPKPRGSDGAMPLPRHPHSDRNDNILMVTCQNKHVNLSPPHSNVEIEWVHVWLHQLPGTACSFRIEGVRAKHVALAIAGCSHWKPVRDRNRFLTFRLLSTTKRGLKVVLQLVTIVTSPPCLYAPSV